MTEWNDDRLDELNERMKDGFVAVDKRFDHVDKRFDHVDERFDHVDMRFEQVDMRFEQVASKEEMGEVRIELRRLNERFDRLLHALAMSAVGFAGAVLATLVGLLVL